MLIAILIILIFGFLLNGKLASSILSGVVLYLACNTVEAATLTTNDDWKLFYAIMICAIWALIYWLCRPVSLYLANWFNPQGLNKEQVTSWLGYYKILILLSCIFNLSLLGEV